MTIDGDVVKANGMMSGGYHKKSNTPLVMWSHYEECREQDKKVIEMRA